MSITASSSFTSSSSPSMSPFLKRIKLQENIKYESPTLLEMEHFENKSLFSLLKSVRQNHNAKWHLIPFTQKYYLLSKQCFIRTFCRAGSCLCDALKYIEKATTKNGKELKDVVDVNVLDEFDKVLEILD